MISLVSDKVALETRALICSQAEPPVPTSAPDAHRHLAHPALRLEHAKPLRRGELGKPRPAPRNQACARTHSPVPPAGRNRQAISPGDSRS